MSQCAQLDMHGPGQQQKHTFWRRAHKSTGRKPVLHGTYREMTSRGKLRGISPALSHSALSLVHVHDEGQRGGLGFLLSATSRTQASTSNPSRGDLLCIVRVFSILSELLRTRTTAVRQNQWVSALVPSSTSTTTTTTAVSAASPGAWRPRDAFSARVYLQAPCATAASLEGIEPCAPCVHSAATTPHCTPTPPLENSPTHLDPNGKSNQTRACGCCTSSRRHQLAGGDPSGSRRSISIQNHAYGGLWVFERASHSPRQAQRKDPAQHTQRNCVISRESAAGVKKKKKKQRGHEPADCSLRLRGADTHGLSMRGAAGEGEPAGGEDI